LERSIYIPWGVYDKKCYNARMIFVVDFGSQTAHLIGRRVRELGSKVKIVHPENILQEVNKETPSGIILSGGPSSVYEKGAPSIDLLIFSLGIPILGICYGLQLTAYLLGGKVIGGKKEYGPATLKLKVQSFDKAQDKSEKLKVTKDLPKSFVVWMSHGDEIVKLPAGFEVLGKTENVPFAFVSNEKQKIYGLLFHPEVEHTEQGMTILKNFIEICNIKTQSSKLKIEELENNIKEKVGEAYVIGAVSGGVDSTVAGILAAKAIGKQFVPIFVDNGLMREGTTEHVKRIFTEKGGVKPIIVNAVGETLKKLRGVTDSEEKRKIIGNHYVEIFEQKMQEFIKSGLPVKFLLQGTIYSDVIESKGSKHAAKIKSHHNVGGLPKNMKLQLLEPLRSFYKDEVRLIGKELGLADEFVFRQPFPGPGYAVRIRGEVTEKRLEQEKMADKIVLEELEKAGILSKVFLSFPVMTGAYSTAVKGDGRQFGEVIALRVVESKDVMTSTWARLPYDVLQRISSRIVNEVPEISRVVYDITTKPPATMEWE